MECKWSLLCIPYLQLWNRRGITEQQPMETDKENAVAPLIFWQCEGPGSDHKCAQNIVFHLLKVLQSAQW